MSETPPANPEDGEFWWHTGVGALYVYYVDADSSQWVLANSVGPQGPQGIQGETGPQGPQGPQGLPGSAKWDIANTGNFTSVTADISHFASGLPGLYAPWTDADTEVIIPTAANGGFQIGDVISLTQLHDSNTRTFFTAGAGVTLLKPSGKTPELSEVYSMMAGTYVTDTWFLVYGDMADA
jgi:hypothetical protein